MTKIVLKNLPKLTLTALLKRRKMSLRRLLDEFGLTTYEGLLLRCDRLGVAPPSEVEFKIAYPSGPVNSPTEGVIVLEALPVINDMTGRHIDPEAPAFPGVVVITDHHDKQQFDEAAGEVEESPTTEPTGTTQRKPRKKKDTNQGD